MSFSERRGTEEADEEIDVPRDLLCGLGPKHIRVLCDNPWEGGRGYRPSDVADMTLDQIFFLLCDRDNLRGVGRNRIKSTGVHSTPAPGSDGLIAGRDSKGNPIRLPVKGESLVSRLNREAKEKKTAAAIANKAKEKKGRRRGT